MKDKRSFQGPSCHPEYFGSLHRFCCTPIPPLLTPMACDGETKCELSIPFLFSESAGAHDCAQTASAWGQPHSLPPPGTNSVSTNSIFWVCTSFIAHLAPLKLAMKHKLLACPE